MALDLIDDLDEILNDSFDKAYLRTKEFEGGYTEDTGGKTNKGITQILLTNYDKQKGNEPRKVKDLNDNDAKAIYKDEFWERPKYDKLEEDVAGVLFDYGVQSSPDRATKAFQNIIGTKEDGLIGPKTIKAQEDYIEKNGKKELLQKIVDERHDFIKTTPAYKKTPDGLDNRIQAIKDEFDLSALNPFAVKEASADEIPGTLDLVNDLDQIEPNKLDLVNDLETPPDPRESLSTGQRILTSDTFDKMLGDGKGLDRAIKATKSGIGSLGKGVDKAIAHTPQTVGEAMMYFGDKLDSETPPMYFDISTPLGKTLKRKGKEIIEKNKIAIAEKYPQAEGKVAQFIEDVGSGVVSIGASLGITALTGPFGAGAAFGISQKLSGYKLAREQGRSKVAADLISGALGITEGGLEYWGLHSLLSSSGGVLLRAAKGTVSEAIQEFSQTGMEGVIKTATGLREYKGFETFRDILAESLYSGAIGAVIGGPGSIATSVAQRNSIVDALTGAGIEQKEAEKRADEMMVKFAEKDILPAVEEAVEDIKKAQKEGKVEERDTGITDEDIKKGQEESSLDLKGIAADLAEIDVPGVEPEATKQDLIDQKTEKRKEKGAIIKSLMETDNIEQTFDDLGYVKDKHGIWVVPEAQAQWERVSDDVKKTLKENGILYVTNTSAEGLGGSGTSIKNGDITTKGVGIADGGEAHIGYNHTALHEAGHAVESDLSQEDKDLFLSGEPVTEHGKKVASGEDANYSKVYGKDSGLVLEEDFAELWALYKGDLEAMRKAKKSGVVDKKRGLDTDVSSAKAEDDDIDLEILAKNWTKMTEEEKTLPEEPVVKAKPEEVLIEEAKKYKSAEEFIKNIDRDALEVFKQQKIDAGEKFSFSDFTPGEFKSKKEWKEKIFIPQLTDIWNKAQEKPSEKNADKINLKQIAKDITDSLPPVGLSVEDVGRSKKREEARKRVMEQHLPALMAEAARLGMDLKTYLQKHTDFTENQIKRLVGMSNLPPKETKETIPEAPEGEEKVRGLSKSVSNQAIEEAIGVEFEGLPKYETRPTKKIIENLIPFIEKNPDLALKIAIGKAPEQGDLRQPELFTALRAKAFADLDFDMIEILGLSEEAAALATEAGQRIQALHSRLAFDPVKTIQEVSKARAEVKVKPDAKKDKQLAELTKKLEETEARIAELEEKIEQSKEDRTRKGTKKFGSNNKIFTQSRVDAARASLRKKLSGLHSGIDPTAVIELTEIGGFYFEGGLRTFGEWSKSLIAEFGDSIKPHLTKVWKSVKKEIAIKGLEASKTRVQKMAEDGDPLPQAHIVQGIAEGLVEMGVLGRGDLVRGVHEILQEFYPDITERETADLISGYGKYSKLNDDQIKVILRDIKGQLQQVSKLEDMQEGKPPSKTGVERRTPSDEERRLIKLVEDAKKKYNIQTTSPESQLKSALDSYKTRLNNQIRDLEKQIRERHKIVKTRSALQLDTEARALLSKKDALKEAFNAIFGKTGLSRSQRIAIAEKALAKSIAVYEEKISQGDLSPINKKTDPISTNKIEDLRSRRKVLKDQLNELRNLANPKRTQAEISLQSLKTRLRGEAQRLQDRLERLDLEKQVKKEVVLDAEAQKLKWERDRIKSAFKAAQYAKEGVTRAEVENIVTMAKDAADAQKKVVDSGDWTADNAKDVEAYFSKKNDFEEYVENLKPKSKTDIVNKFFDYMRASILASPRILRNSFLYQVVPGVERAITKRIVTGSFNDADLKSSLFEKFLAKLSGVKPSAKSLDFIRRQTAMTARIYHKTGIDISRLDKMDSASRFFGERVGKFVGKSIIEKYAKIVSLGPKWFAGGTDMLFAAIGRADTAIMMSKEIAKIEALRGVLPEGMTETQRADQLLKESYSFTSKDKRANDIRNAGIMDAHMMNNTQAGSWSDWVISLRKMFKFKNLSYGKVFVPFAKIASVVVAEGVKTTTGIGIVKSLHDITVANRKENEAKRATLMRSAATDLIRYVGLAGATVLLAAMLDDDDYVGAYSTISRKEYGLAKARNAGTNYVRIGGRWVPLRYLPMLNIPISAIMTARQAKKSIVGFKEKTLLEKANILSAGYFIGMLGQILDAPGLPDIGEVLDNAKKAARGPSAWGSIAKSFGMDGEGMSNWAKVRIIPSAISYDVWNFLFPKDAKYDFMGREIIKGSPFKKDTSNEITIEISRLADAGEFPVISDPSSKAAKLLEESMGETEYNDYLAELKQNYAKGLSRIIASGKYRIATDEKKKNMINAERRDFILDEIKRKAKYL